MSILVTGGAGYIGSHTVLELLNIGEDVVIMDNLSNSRMEGLNRVAKITGRDFKFYKADLLNLDDLDKIFTENEVNSVIHFAGLKAVGESVAIPLNYYHNNITGTLNLLFKMKQYGVKKLVFSSSATVYGDPKEVPIRENFPLSATNPYGKTKLYIEEILRDLYHSDKSFNIVLLRYFNPVGAHESGMIGEDPNGIPNNLMPYITQVSVGKLAGLKVFGNDYPTHDGTGVRDYIHVVDLARGHLKALEKLDRDIGLFTYNLGTGNGYSVLDVVKAYEKASGRTIPYSFTERRPGDIASCYADPSLATKELGWKAEFDMNRMCEDSYRWQSSNPEGYK
ncbi:MAG: UDP-glucose 4-epimerase GalE [Candidatus Delongbacteria bacterium]|nr:UDP-glucose 4-epimerase GalE [Candidatus Delongbacteria bacterium]MBN2836583.1 UDP-glucose 4-epimerase GalE [Candidatus Delongbacteria bacterium]